MHNNKCSRDAVATCLDGESNDRMTKAIPTCSNKEQEDKRQYEEPPQILDLPSTATQLNLTKRAR